MHTVAAGYVAASVFVLGISSWYLLRGRDPSFAIRSFAVAAGFGLASALSVIVLGDESGYTTGEVQKVKLAAIEAEWETQKPPASFTVFGFPDQEAEKTHFAIKIPWLMGLIATRSFDTPVTGIKDLKHEHETRIRNGMLAYAALQRVRGGDRSAGSDGRVQRGARPTWATACCSRSTRRTSSTRRRSRSAPPSTDTIPNVAPMFWSFRIMVGLGLWFLFLFVAAFVILARRRLAENRWLLRVALWSIPLPWIAMALGWIVAEYGRQPWSISEVLPTHLSVSTVTVGQVWFSLAGFVAFYTALLVVEIYLMFKYARLGPSSLGTGRYHFEAAPCRSRAPCEVRMIYVFDYATLKLIWWVFVGVLLVGFAIMDGMDLGSARCCRSWAGTDDERRVMLNTIGPHWEGNQVWFITAGGATFAAWPLVYATAFSGFYVALILTLFALFFRPVGFDYRSKVPDPRWRNAWDWGIFVGGTVPALVFGVAFGNLLQGVPFHFDADLRVHYTGSFFGLLNPFALLAGVVSVAMLAMHGAIYLQLRTEGRRAAARGDGGARIAGGVFIVTFAGAGVWLASGIEGYAITAMPPANSPFVPLAKTVAHGPGGWLRGARPPSVDGHRAARRASPARCSRSSRLAAPRRCSRSCCRRTAVAGVVLTAGFALFPFVMPSSTDPRSSLTRLGLGVEPSHAADHVLGGR